MAALTPLQHQALAWIADNPGQPSKAVAEGLGRPLLTVLPALTELVAGKLVARKQDGGHQPITVTLLGVALLAAIGEPASLRDRTLRWIAEHPGRTGRAVARGVRADQGRLLHVLGQLGLDGLIDIEVQADGSRRHTITALGRAELDPAGRPAGASAGDA